MNSSATITPPAELCAAAGFRAVLGAALRRVTWRVVAATLAIVVALDVWFVFDVASEDLPQIPAPEAYLSGTIVNLLMAFSVMFTAFVADEMVARGAKRLPAYACAVLAGCAVAVLVQWQVHHWLHLRTRYELPQVPHEAVLMQAVALFFEYLIWGSIIVSIYVNRRTALLASARMNAAQVQRVQAQRRALESRLQALQARVEPQFLFNTLAQVRDLYDSDPAKGGEVLGELTVYLRAALPHLRDSTSTLDQELRLARAYLSIMQVKLSGRFAFDIDAPEAALAARMPAMILLPLINSILAGGTAPATDSAIRITASATGGKLRVELEQRGRLLTEASDAILHDIRQRLRVLHRDRGGLGIETSSGLATRIVVEIPHEAMDGSHR